MVFMLMLIVILLMVILINCNKMKFASGGSVRKMMYDELESPGFNS